MERLCPHCHEIISHVIGRHNFDNYDIEDIEDSDSNGDTSWRCPECDEDLCYDDLLPVPDEDESDDDNDDGIFAPIPTTTSTQTMQVQ